LIERMESHIKRLARIEELKIVDQLASSKGSARAVVGVSEIAVPLEGLIDFEKEKARLEKESNKLINEREGLEKRLSNQDFISRAAADVVETTRARAEELDDQITKLRAVIEAL
jgi:valyl-tRNA synthetase